MKVYSGCKNDSTLENVFIQVTTLKVACCDYIFIIKIYNIRSFCRVLNDERREKVIKNLGKRKFQIYLYLTMDTVVYLKNLRKRSTSHVFFFFKQLIINYNLQVVSTI